MLSRVGHNPAIVLLVIMFLGVFLSMWWVKILSRFLYLHFRVTNVAAPVVCCAIIRPMLDSLPVKEVYAKVLLLGIAFSNNIGGMLVRLLIPIESTVISI